MIGYDESWWIMIQNVEISPKSTEFVKIDSECRNNENMKKRCLKVSKGSSRVNNDVKGGAIEAKDPKSRNIELTS